LPILKLHEVIHARTSICYGSSEAVERNLENLGGGQWWHDAGFEGEKKIGKKFEYFLKLLVFFLVYALEEPGKLMRREEITP
jgi:hypothetical protein